MITIIYGVPGCGKSTIMASMVQMNKRKKEKYYNRVSKSKLYKWLNSINVKHIDILSSRKMELMIKYYNRLRFKQKLKLRWTIFKCKLSMFIFDLFYKKNFYDVVYCTDETMQDTVFVDYKDWGRFKPTWNSLFLGEEAGIGALDNHEWKKLDKLSKRFAAIHRHMGVSIVLVSQTCDISTAYRFRSEKIYHATKLGPFTFLRRITYKVDVNEAHELVDMYDKVPVLNWILELLGSISRKRRFAKERWNYSYFIYRPAWYKYFDSYVDNFDYPDIDPYFEYLEQLEQKENEDDEEFQKY